MSGTELYRRALVRFAISLILTIADALICPIALYNTFGNGVMFALVLLLMIPWAWTLVNIWQHTLAISGVSRTPFPRMSTMMVLQPSIATHSSPQQFALLSQPPPGRGFCHFCSTHFQRRRSCRIVIVAIRSASC